VVVSPPTPIASSTSCTERKGDDAFDRRVRFNAVFEALRGAGGELQRLVPLLDGQRRQLDRAALVGRQFGQAPVHAVRGGVVLTKSGVTNLRPHLLS
jgi:hypothetical protein